jgi:hypothetical protein
VKVYFINLTVCKLNLKKQIHKNENPRNIIYIIIYHPSTCRKHSNSTTSNIRSAPPSAYAPGVNSSGIDVCSTGASMGIQTFGLGVSGGKSFRDENCERIKLSRQLDSMGMKVAAVALLCQDPRVFEAMIHAGTPCPYQGKIGNEANQLWKKYDKLRPDYNQYVKDLKVIKRIDKKHDEIIIEKLPSINSTDKSK